MVYIYTNAQLWFNFIFMILVTSFYFEVQIIYVWSLKWFKMKEVLCVVTFDTICSSKFQTKCVNCSMQTPQHVMPMAMENLIITQYWDTFQYANVWEGSYQLQVCRFKLGDYVYLQHSTPTMLDVIVRCVILHLEKVLPFGVLMLGYKMIKHGRIMYIIVHHVIFLM